MLPNEIFALSCRAYYDEQGLIVDKTNGEFAHCPYPEGMGETGYYLLHEHHQQQGLLQSKDLGKCCFFAGDAKKWLLSCNYFPDNYFELWDIYEKYVSLNGAEGAKAANAEKDEDGRSITAVKAGKASMDKLTEEERIAKASKAGKASMDKLTEEERIALASKAAKAAHAEKDENGKSINAVKGGKAANEVIHAEKDADGKSVHAVKAGKAAIKVTLAEKDARGKSINAVKGGKKGGKKAGAINKQKTQKRTELIRICDGAIFTFDCMRDAARTLNLNPSNISKVCQGKQKSTKGYTAKYI